MMISFRYNEGTEERVIDSFHIMLVDENGTCLIRILDEPDGYYEIEYEEYARVKKLVLGVKNEL